MSARLTMGMVAILGALAAGEASAITVCVSKTGTPGGVPCYDTIQHGVNAAAAAGPGGIVKVNAGTYFESVTMPNTAGGGDGMQIIGASKLTTILDSGAPVNNFGIILGTSTGVKIANMGFANNLGAAIYGATAHPNTVIMGVRSVGCQCLYGIAVVGDGVQVVSSEVHAAPQYGIVVQGNNATLKSNTVTQVGVVALYSIGVATHVLSNKVFDVGNQANTIVYGILALSSGSVVTGNSVENLGPVKTGSHNDLPLYGLIVSDNKPTVSGNKLTNAGALYVACSSCAAGGQVKSNAITGNIATGDLVVQNNGLVVITDAAGLVVQSNKLVGTGGVLATGSSGLTQGNGVTLLQNSVTGTNLFAACFQVFGSGHTLTTNTAKACGASGFYTNGDNFLLQTNQVQTAAFSGFAVDGNNGNTASFTGVDLESNKVSGAYQQGFALFDGQTSHGPFQPTGTVIDGNAVTLSRQDLCNEAGGTFPSNSFTTVSTTCDVRK